MATEDVYKRQPNGTYYTVAWNKLYRAEVWKLLHYPEGRLHEDDSVSYTHLDVYKRQLPGCARG